MLHGQQFKIVQAMLSHSAMGSGLRITEKGALIEPKSGPGRPKKRGFAKLDAPFRGLAIRNIPTFLAIVQRNPQKSC